MLAGTNVVLGVTGSIAAVKVVELAHELRRAGAEVRGVMTESATNIIHPWALEFATENPVVTEITGAVEHVELFGDEGWADVFLIAPATANTVGKMAAAIDDTPVTTCTTTAIGSGTPVVVAPAMHEPMYDHPGVLESIETLEEWGICFIDPVIEEGKAKMATEDAIVLDTARAAGERPLAGKHIVVTSGSTTEPIDPVRVISNKSSGKTGRAVAKALYADGAEVSLVHDRGAVPYASVTEIETAEEMRTAVMESVETADALISVAAISDFTVEPVDSKIRSGERRSLDLDPAPKLIDAVREAHPDLPIVGFKAESGADRSLVEVSRELQDRVGLSFVVGNDAAVMGEDDTEAILVDGESVEEFAGSKMELGQRISAELAARLKQ